MKLDFLTFSFGDTLQVWRIFVASIAFQIVGGVIGVAYDYHYFGFINAWLGMMVAIIPGLAIGTIWHRSKAAGNPESDRLIRFLWAVGLSVCIVGAGTGVPHWRTEMRNLADISKLPQKGILQIDVLDGDARKKMLAISDPSTVASFTRSIADAIGHPANHMQVTHSWYLIASGSTKHEFRLFLDSRFPERVFGNFVVRSDNTISNRGSFQSYALRPWVEKHLM